MKVSVSIVRRTFAVVTALVLSAGSSLFASEVIHWNRLAVESTTRALPLNPLAESHILAIVHLAMHDAANTVAPHFATYAPSQREETGASVEAAIAAAAHATLCNFLPTQTATFDAELEIRARTFTDTAARSRGFDVGKRVAAALIALRKNDGADIAATRAPGTQPGDYRPTPPDFTPAALSNWGEVRPFALTSSHQFRPAPPPAPSSLEALADIEEVRAIGGAVSMKRSFEQSEIASYWYEDSTRGWNRIAREVTVTQNLDLWQQARLLALVNVAMADGFIGGFEAKYHYHYWRPATAIRESGDTDWVSYLPTPPVPDYPSTHTVLGAAAATVLAECLGTDYVSFTMTSGAPFPNITRRFWSFSQAARENGSSRVLAGLHFTRAVEAGYRQGVEIGTWAATKTLLPRDAKSTVKLSARK